MGCANINKSDGKGSKGPKLTSHNGFNKKNNIWKVALLGEASVGKSCIMERACHNRFIEGYESTVGLEFGKLELMSGDGENISIQIWDTAGQERFRSLISNYYRDAHGILLVYDLTNTKTFD